jgi:hypothetical protein
MAHIPCEATQPMFFFCSNEVNGPVRRAAAAALGADGFPQPAFMRD